MPALFRIITVFLCAREALSRAVVLETRDNITLPAPIIAVPSLHWEGVDGRWSTFQIRVGTPKDGKNIYRVLPATSWQETWVVYGAAAGFCATDLGVRADCAEDRGGVFDSANSPTWMQTNKDAVNNQFFLGLDQSFGYDGVGQYGFDTVGLGYEPSQGPTLPNQIVSEIVTNTFWFGILGLSFQPTNFTTYTNQNVSFAETLFANGSIASRTWSYTAGAAYRLGGKVYGSLIFGGYDASRFVPNDVRFNMNSDLSKDLTLNIRSITSTTSSGTTTLSNTPIFAFIDSALPELWLPTAVCQEFEKALGIKFNETSGNYLIDGPTHDKLVALNPNITLTLANDATVASTVDISLPYAAFDVNISAPLYANGTSYYFPIMRASDADSYRLGRTFLQEAYVTANYHTKTFNVSQCIFDDSASARVIAIPSVVPTAPRNDTGDGNSNTPKNSGSSKKLGGGAIAGIVIGVLALLAVAGSVVACCLGGLLCFPKRKNKDSRPSTPVAEIDTGKRIEPGVSAYEEQASAFISEVSGKDAFVEIQGNPIMHPQELEADVPIPPGMRESDRVNGVSDSSRATDSTGVSSMSPITEHPQKTPMAELGAQERGLGETEHLVSPNTPTIPENSMMGRAQPDVRSESPAISEATWDPNDAPVQRRGTNGSRFEEQWDETLRSSS